MCGRGDKSVFVLCRVIILYDNYQLPLPVGSFFILTWLTQLITHTCSRKWHDNCQIQQRPCIRNLPLCSTESFHPAQQLRNLDIRSWYQWHLLSFLHHALQFEQLSPLRGSCYLQNEEVLMWQLQIYFSLMSMNIQHMVFWDVTACNSCCVLCPEDGCICSMRLHSIIYQKSLTRSCNALF